MPAPPRPLSEVVAAAHRLHPSLDPLPELLLINPRHPDSPRRLARCMAEHAVPLHEAVARPSQAVDRAARRPVLEAGEDATFRRAHHAAVAAVTLARLGAVPTTTIDATDYWRGAIATGALAALVASIEGVHRDTAFAAGLMDQAGLLLLDQVAPETFASAAARVGPGGTSLREAIVVEFGFDDATLAGVMGIRWGLPPWLVAACAPAVFGDGLCPDPADLAGIMWHARIVARMHGYGSQFGREPGDDEECGLMARLFAQLGRLGGPYWLAARVDGLLAVTSPNGTAAWARERAPARESRLPAYMLAGGLQAAAAP